MRRAAGVLVEEHRPITPRPRVGHPRRLPRRARAATAPRSRRSKRPARCGAPSRSSPGWSSSARAADPARAIEAIAAMPVATAVLHRTLRRARDAGRGLRNRRAGRDAGRIRQPALHHDRPGGARRRRPRSGAGLASAPPRPRSTPTPASPISRRKRATRPTRSTARSASWSRGWSQREDIRGDLHMHTTYSDGRDSLRRMVQAAHALGYEYIAITDHSEHAGASRTLTLDELGPAARRNRPRCASEAPGMTILHGLEVDILPDGTLDCPDARPRRARHRPRLAPRLGRPRRRAADAALPRRDPASAGVGDHPSGQPAGRPARRLRHGLRRHLRGGRRDRHGARDRRRPVAPRPQRRARARGGRGRRDRGDRQRLPPRAGCSIGRCGWASAPPAAAGSSRATS